MHPVLEKILASAPIITDGAWGTELQARGLETGEFPDLWNLTNPEKVAEVAQAYVQAGSQVILTNTFGANRVRLASHQLEDKVLDLNKAGVALSKRAANGNAFVFASIGPSGKMLMTGETSEEELRAAFAEQAKALAEGGADALVVETMADLDEARIAVEAARITGLPIVACMVYDAGKNKDRTMNGNTPEQAAEALTAAGADVIGANCGQGIAGFIPICQRLRAVTSKPLWMKANAGLPELINDKIVYKTTPADFAVHGPALVAAGAQFVGGCCGTNPEYIKALKAAVK